MSPDSSEGLTYDHPSITMVTNNDCLVRIGSVDNTNNIVHRLN
jgi:hypothetical protein